MVGSRAAISAAGGVVASAAKAVRSMSTLVIEELLSKPNMPLNALVPAAQAALDSRAAGNRLSVTTFSTQLCEVKTLYQLIRPPPTTRALEHGRDFHALIEMQVMRQYPGWVPFVQTDDEVENYRRRLMGMAFGLGVLADQRDVAELRLVGTAELGVGQGSDEGSAINLSGIVDSLYWEGGKCVVADTKTTASTAPPPEWKIRLAYHQITLYRWMLERMLDPHFDIVPLIRRTEFPNDPLPKTVGDPRQRASEIYLQPAYEDVREAVKRLRAKISATDLSMDLRVEFRSLSKAGGGYNVTLGYDPELAAQLVSSQRALWLQHREPLAVGPDNFTPCRTCFYRDECAVLARLPDEDDSAARRT